MEPTRVVPISLVDNNPFNARVIYDDAIVARLSRELRADGQIVAALAVPSTLRADRFTLIDGHYRLRALQAAGLSTILLDVRDPMPDVELFRLSFALNEHRSAQTVLDNALAWRRLLASGAVDTRAALQAIIGKSPASISKTLQLLDLPADVLAVIKGCPSRFGLRLSYALLLLCKAGSTSDALRLARRATTEEIPRVDIDAAVVRTQSGANVRLPRSKTQRFPIEHAGCVGTIKSSASGKVVVDLSFADPSRRVLFVEQLKLLAAIHT